jgi:hypothetical protein
MKMVKRRQIMLNELVISSDGYLVKFPENGLRLHRRCKNLQHNQALVVAVQPRPD